MKKILSEEYLRKLIRETIIDEAGEFGLNVKGDLTLNDIKSGVPLYHRPNDRQDGEAVIKSLFKYGFSREYTNSNGGNMYGAGVYTVYSLGSSQTHATGYGHSIIKAYLLGGYEDFLIFNQDIAKQVYGDGWRIETQFDKLLPKNMAEKAKKHFNSHNSSWRTSDMAYSMYLLFGKELDKTKIRGFVFTGGHDGNVCVVRDFSSVIPVEISYDNGRTWKIGITDELIKMAGSSTDTFFKYKNAVDNKGEKYFDDVSPRAVNGFVVVHKNKKTNYINVKTDELISDIWFDRGTDFNDEGCAIVELDGEKAGLYYDGDIIYICDDDWQIIKELK